MIKENDGWKGRELVFSVNRDLKTLTHIECPRCGLEHRIDDPREKAEETLYCDTYDIQIPFPKPVRDWMKESSVKFHGSLEKGGQGVRPVMKAGQKYVGIELRFKF